MAPTRLRLDHIGARGGLCGRCGCTVLPLGSPRGDNWDRSPGVLTPKPPRHQDHLPLCLEIFSQGNMLHETPQYIILQQDLFNMGLAPHQPSSLPEGGRRPQGLLLAESKAKRASQNSKHTFHPPQAFLRTWTQMFSWLGYQSDIHRCRFPGRLWRNPRTLGPSRKGQSASCCETVR